MKMKNESSKEIELEKILIYIQDENFKINPSTISNLLSEDVEGIFKYVVFRDFTHSIKTSNDRRYIRMSPVREVREYYGNKEFRGDTHLTIISRFIQEIGKERYPDGNVPLADIEFHQKNGSELLRLLNGFCAEAGAFMKIQGGSIYLYGNSSALEKGRIYYVDGEEAGSPQEELAIEINNRRDYLTNVDEFTIFNRHIYPAFDLKKKLGNDTNIYIEKADGNFVEINNPEIKNWLEIVKDRNKELFFKGWYRYETRDEMKEVFEAISKFSNQKK